MPTGRAPAPLTHEAFRQRQKSVELDGLSYKPLRVAWTDLGEGDAGHPPARHSHLVVSL